MTMVPKVNADSGERGGVPGDNLARETETDSLRGAEQLLDPEQR